MPHAALLVNGNYAGPLCIDVLPAGASGCARSTPQAGSPQSRLARGLHKPVQNDLITARFPLSHSACGERHMTPPSCCVRISTILIPLSFRINIPSRLRYGWGRGEFNSRRFSTLVRAVLGELSTLISCGEIMAAPQAGMTRLGSSGSRDCGVSASFVCGVMGMAPKLTAE